MRNLLTLCGTCHGLVHRDLVRIEFDGYGRPRFTSRNGVPLHRSKRPQLVAPTPEPSLTYANPDRGCPAPRRTSAQRHHPA